MAPLVAADAARSEREARTTPPVAERIIDAGLWRLYLPRSVDAPELDLVPALEVFEAASRIDGSFGWAVTIGSGGGLFAGALEPATAAEIFGSREALIAGSGKPGGTAKPVDSGYLAGGRWNFASGAHYATFFTANCILEGERPADGGDGPVIRAMAFPAGEVEIIETWENPYTGETNKVMHIHNHGQGRVRAPVPLPGAGRGPDRRNVLQVPQLPGVRRPQQSLCP